MVKEKVERDVNVNEIICDYEKGLINSIKKNFKQNVRGFYFHYAQSLYKNINKSFSKDEIKENKIIIECFKKLKYMSFIPSSLVIDIFEKLKSDYEEEEILQKYLKYFEKTWIKEYDILLWIFLILMNIVQTMLANEKTIHYKLYSVQNHDL